MTVAYEPPTELRTDRLRLRPVDLDDAEAIFAAYGADPEVTTYLTWPPNRDVEQVREFLRGLVERGADGTELGFVMELGGTLVGMVGVRVGAHGLELGCVLAREYWGRGLMTEAVQAVMDDARSQDGVFRVWSYHDIDNPASGRVMEKAGMTRESVLRRFMVHPNVSPEPRDCVSYSWVRPDGSGSSTAGTRLHHVQLAMPAGEGDTAREFFVDVLGMTEVAKPPELAARGGAWFRRDGLEIHCGVEEDFSPARKAHPGILTEDLDGDQQRLADAGYPVQADDRFPGYRRFYTTDCFGNRLEFLERK